MSSASPLTVEWWSDLTPVLLLIGENNKVESGRLQRRLQP